MKKALFLGILACCFLSFARSEDKLSEKLNKFGSEYARQYLTPLSNAFGADINSGWFHNADPGKTGFHLYIGVQAFAVPVSDADKSFHSTFMDTVVYNGVHYFTTITAQGPTAFGDDQTQGTITYTVNGTPFVDSTAAGLNLNYAPLGVPQVTVGSFMGTDLTVRYLPSISLGDFGKIGFWGIGVRHSISQYLGPEPPVDVAAQVGFQGLSVTDSTNLEIIKASAFMANIEVSKSFSLLTLYGGLQTEKSSLDIQYHRTITGTGTNTQYVLTLPTLDGSNTFRALVGANLNLLGLNLNVDYNIGSVNVFTAGLGIQL